MIGNGNVAIDVARMLVLAPEELAPTDTADHALEVLAASRVKEVVVVGRRGPAQAAFTNPELLELGELADADVIVDEAELERGLAVHDEQAEEDATARRNVEILRSYAQREPTGRPKRIVLRFLLSPTALLAGENGHLGAIELVRNELVAGARAAACVPRPPASTRRSPAGLVFRAIGYRGIPLPRVPFDERSGVIPNEGGRVTDAESGTPLAGEYVVGWIKRGPSGVIGTNKKDAQETVDAIFADLASTQRQRGRAPRTGAARRRTRSRRCCASASRSSSPTRAGKRSTATSARSARPPGRPRVKVTSIEEMLRIAAAEEP